MNNRKGIILAGGTGSRLFPITKAVSKQLLHIYDKPMIYYPLTTLIYSGLKEILIITTPQDQEIFKRLIGDGSHLGMEIKYAIQIKPEGLAQAFIIGKDFIKDSPVALILGDNLFHGEDIKDCFDKNSSKDRGATIFAYEVKDPERYGVVEFDSNFKVLEIKEKPLNPKTRFAITGLYLYDNSIVEKAEKVRPSKRGELEITDLNIMYLNEDLLDVQVMSRGTAWLDTGNFNSLHQASSYIRTIEQRQGIKVGSPEEAAWRMGWITNEQLEKLAKPLACNEYGQYLLGLLS